MVRQNSIASTAVSIPSMPSAVKTVLLLLRVSNFSAWYFLNVVLSSFRRILWDDNWATGLYDHVVNVTDGPTAYMTSFSLPSVFKPSSAVRQLSTNYFVTTFSAWCRSALTELQQILCLLTQAGLNIGDLDLVRREHPQKFGGCQLLCFTEATWKFWAKKAPSALL